MALTPRQRAKRRFAESMTKAMVGPRHRAYTVLATETTRAGKVAMQSMLNEAPEISGWYWTTQGDVDVCDECAAEEGVYYESSEMFDAAHPNCRCYPIPAKEFDSTDLPSFDDWETIEQSLEI